MALDQEKRLHALEQLAQPKENSHAIPEAVPSPTQGSIPDPMKGPFRGWLLDLYPTPQGMTLWLMDREQNRRF